MNRLNLNFALLILLLAGCSAALVPATNDPRQKILQTYQLIDMGRPIPAEKLATEAAAIYEQQNNFVGAGTAYSALGMLYSSSAYRSFERYYRQQGTYDPTPEKSRIWYMKSIESYKKGGDYWGAANSFVGIGDGYTDQNDLENACKAYISALNTYSDPNAKFMGMAYTWNPKYPTYKSMLEALVSKSCKQ